jgi:PAS domain S-box-containing protein
MNQHLEKKEMYSKSSISNPRDMESNYSGFSQGNRGDVPQLDKIEREVVLDPTRTIISKTDPKGIIEYANDYFMEVSGYEEYELMGQPHSIIRHPDMPKVVFKLLWSKLKKGENIHALVKNRTKDGNFYWVITNFETKYDDEGNIIAYYAQRKAAPDFAVYKIEKLYKTLRAIEQAQGMSVAEKYLNGYLEERGLDYNQLVYNLLTLKSDDVKEYFHTGNQSKRVSKKKKGLFARLFKK